MLSRCVYSWLPLATEGPFHSRIAHVPPWSSSMEVRAAGSGWTISVWFRIFSPEFERILLMSIFHYFGVFSGFKIRRGSGVTELPRT